MICGVPVAAIAEPHSVWWPGAGLREVLVDPMALPRARFGLVGPVESLADPSRAARGQAAADESTSHKGGSTMAWLIERRGEHIALVTMTTNKAKAQVRQKATRPDFHHGCSGAQGFFGIGFGLFPTTSDALRSCERASWSWGQACSVPAGMARGDSSRPRWAFFLVSALRPSAYPLL